MKTLHLVLLATFVCLPSLSTAESLKIKNLRAQQEENLQKEIVKTNKACETSLIAELDWNGTNDEDFGKYSFSGYCDNALSGIERVCGKPNGKESVKSKIKKIVCHFGPTRTIALKDDTIDYTVQWGSGNDSDYVSEYLMNNL